MNIHDILLEFARNKKGEWCQKTYQRTRWKDVVAVNKHASWIYRWTFGVSLLKWWFPIPMACIHRIHEGGNFYVICVLCGTQTRLCPLPCANFANDSTSDTEDRIHDTVHGCLRPVPRSRRRIGKSVLWAKTPPCFDFASTTWMSCECFTSIHNGS